jgi:integrase
MPRFRKAHKQAEHAIKQKLSIGLARHDHKTDRKIHSVGTARNYTQALTRLTQWIQTNRLGDLKMLTADKAVTYLTLRGQSVGQKTLNQERQAIQLCLGITLPVIKSELTHALKSRAYTTEQIPIIAKAQSPSYQLATHLAAAAGLRAHELLTLRKSSEQTASTHRVWLTQRFWGRTGERYTVKGKGGLIREVLIPIHLVKQLEQCRLAQPRIIIDRKIHYRQYYDIGGGHYWSNSFSAASKRTLGWSHGAHGLRHSYAQTRMEALQQQGFLYQDALEIVSQEMGHFRSTITEVYLR